MSSQSPKVTVQEIPPMRLIGISADFVSILSGTHGNATQVIPEIWSSLMTKLSAHPDLKLGWGVGAVGPAHSPQGIEGELNYFAGFVLHSAEVPDGLSTLHIPGGHHAVCEHVGPLSKLADTTAWFFTEWFPQSGLEWRQDFPLEIYDERYKGDAEDSVVLITTPVKALQN